MQAEVILCCRSISLSHTLDINDRVFVVVVGAGLESGVKNLRELRTDERNRELKRLEGTVTGRMISSYIVTNPFLLYQITTLTVPVSNTLFVLCKVQVLRR